MPTILTHPAVPLAIGLGLGSGLIPVRLLLAGVAASILPDLDVVAFHLGLPYAHDFGHRGVSHSLLFVLLIAVLAASFYHYLRASVIRVFSFILQVTASHGILDAFTNGGLGIAFFWPFSATRYFAPTQFIEVSPLSISRIFSSRFVEVMFSELLWIWLPCLILMLIIKASARFIQMPSLRNN